MPGVVRVTYKEGIRQDGMFFFFRIIEETSRAGEKLDPDLRSYIERMSPKPSADEIYNISHTQ